MSIDTQRILELRQLTGAGVMDCKRALEEAAGDLEKARALLAAKAAEAAGKRADREIAQGVVEAYVHPGNRIGVLIEVRCETDFLANSPEFRHLVKELCLQIASEAPEYVYPDDVPAEVIERVRQEATANAKALGKPEPVIEQIAAGKVDKYLSHACLLRQRSIKNPDVTIAEMIQALIASSGENIRVIHFTRYEIPR